MNWPGWMKDNVWQWLTGLSIGIIGIIVSVVLFIFSSSTPPAQEAIIIGDNNIQVTGSNVTINEEGPEERAKQDAILKTTEENKQVLKRIEERLDANKIEQTPQLVNELKNKINELEAELEERTRTTKDKRADEALAAFKNDDYDKARELFETLREEEKKKEAEHAKTAYNLGNVYFVELNFPKALDAYLDAVRLAPDNTTYLNETGKTFDTLAQYDKAIEYYEKALKSDLKTYGEEHPNIATYRNNLGRAWRAKGQYDKAIEYYEKALKSDLKTYGEEHPDVAIGWNNLGEAWKAKGQYDKAIEYYEKALKSDIKTYGEEHPNVATYWNNLGGAWKAKGQYDKAIEYLEKALKSDLNTFGEEHPNIAIIWNNLGESWRAKGQYDKAIEYYEKSLKVLKKAGLHHYAEITENNIKIAREQRDRE
ncbi:MAG: tetratricopeptide repeat protein [Candidatus Scalindua sp.]|nr:tetratricopeptide repeat protein [Candidatus Scalindua sp.]